MSVNVYVCTCKLYSEACFPLVHKNRYKDIPTENCTEHPVLNFVCANGTQGP